MYELRIFLSIEAERNKGPLFRLCGLAAIVALLELFGVSLIVPVVALLAGSDPFASLPFVQLFVQLREVSWRMAFGSLVGLLLVTYLIKAAVQFIFHYLQTSLVAQWQCDLANKLVQRYLYVPYPLHSQRNSAELIRNITNLVQETYGQFLNALFNFMIDATAATALVVLALVIAPVPAVAAGLLMVVTYSLQHRIFRNIHDRLGIEKTEIIGRQYLWLQQSLGAFREARVTRRESFFFDHLRALNDRLRTNVRQFELVARLVPVVGDITMITSVTVAGLILVAIVSEPSQVLASLGFLAAVAFRLTPLVNRVAGATGVIRNARAGLVLLATEIAASPHPLAAVLAASPFSFRKTIEFRDVCFHYAESRQPALRNINLTIQIGETVGIVGPSGAGKSTLVDLLVGLLEPTQGKLLVDGRKLEDGQYLRAGYVPQHSFLFDDTLRANIAFGVPPDRIDDARVRQSLRLVHLDMLVAEWPAGINTPLGERGAILSGGQRQRIGIARALYDMPELLIMDEATSAMDVRTEEQVTDAIAALHGNLTIMVIAHRLSTVRNCDRIVFMADGGIVDQGTFDELRNRNANFRQLVELTMMEASPAAAKEITPLNSPPV